jgi:hypothetical protein
MYPSSFCALRHHHRNSIDHLDNGTSVGSHTGPEIRLSIASQDQHTSTPSTNETETYSLLGDRASNGRPLHLTLRVDNNPRVVCIVTKEETHKVNSRITCREVDALAFEVKESAILSPPWLALTDNNCLVDYFHKNATLQQKQDDENSDAKKNNTHPSSSSQAFPSSR